VVFGGGSLFTDAESWKAPVFWWFYAFVAWCYGRKIVLAFQGIGPCSGTIAKWTTGWVLLRASLVSVRDPKSLDRVTGFLGETGMKNKIVVRTFDPAIAIFKGTSRNSAKKLIIVPRMNTTTEFLADVQAEVAKGWNEVVVLLLEPREDQHAAQQVRQAIKHDAVRTVEVRSFHVLAGEVSSASFVLTQRFHGAVAALANTVPFRAVPQKPGDKLDEANRMDPAKAQELLQAGENALKAFLRNP
jgi:polysaccharide pyruvyl transferase WcaK-like protein